MHVFFSFFFFFGGGGVEGLRLAQEKPFVKEWFDQRGVAGTEVLLCFSFENK